MAAPHASLPHLKGHTEKQTKYLPDTEDFGFDTLPLPTASSPTINALPPCGTEDFVFDSPLLLAVSSPTINTLPPCGTEAFGFDSPPLLAVSSPTIDALPPHGTEDFIFDGSFIQHPPGREGIMPREQDDFGRDAEVQTEEKHVEGTLLDPEYIEMDGPHLLDFQGPFSDLLKTCGTSLVNLWTVILTLHWQNIQLGLGVSMCHHPERLRWQPPPGNFILGHILRKNIRNWYV
jgi:hypothetical protein